MQVQNNKSFERIAFDEYLKLPGKSFSSLKYADQTQRTPTSKMLLGTAVDAYLFTPETYHGQYYDKVRPIVLKLKQVFGDSLKQGKSQLSITADFVHEDLLIQYKGRPDFQIYQTIVDLKVSELPITQAINFFRYDWQLSGYSQAAKCKHRVLLSIHPKTNEVQMMNVALQLDWWHYNILKFGTPVNLKTTI